ASTLNALSVPSRSRLAASREATTSVTRESVATCSRPTRQVLLQAIDHVARVVLDAADERRLASAKHRQAKRVQTWTVDDAVVAEVALRIDDRHVEPAVLGPIAGRPHDRSDLAGSEVELQSGRSRHLRRREALRNRAPVPGPLVERVQQPFHLQVGERAHVPAPAGEERSTVADGRPPTDELDAHRRQRVEVERRPFVRADELRRREPPRALEIVELVVPLIPDARSVHPPEDVA